MHCFFISFVNVDFDPVYIQVKRVWLSGAVNNVKPLDKNQHNLNPFF